MFQRFPSLFCLWLAALPMTICEAQAANKTSRSGIEKDLKLQVRLTGSPVIRPQEPIQLRIKLVNSSRTRSYHVIKPGDGSEVGWREPHVYFTAEAKDKDGRWRSLPKRRLLRCGMYDSDWHKDVVELKPGRSLPLKEWLPAPERGVELQKAGEVRLYVHYQYSQGRAGKGRAAGAAPKNRGKMGATPAFHLVSKPVLLKVVRPLDLRLKARRARLVAGKTYKLSTILSVSITNRTRRKVGVTPPTASGAAQLRFELGGEQGRSPRIDANRGASTTPVPLRPGQTASMLGTGPLGRGLDGHWSYPKAGRVRLRATYAPTGKRRGEIASDWIEIEFAGR